MVNYRDKVVLLQSCFRCRRVVVNYTNSETFGLLFGAEFSTERIEDKCIEGFILAGGASSRMGQDKTELLLGGKTFIEHAAFSLQTIAPQNVYIVGNGNIKSSGLPTLLDAVDKNARGAIIGLYTALVNTKTEWTAVLACDLPFVTRELFEKLISLATEDFDAVVPVQHDGRAQPLCALYRRESCLPVVEEMLGEGVWKLQELLRRVKTRFVEFAILRDLPRAEHFFFNVNTPEDYQKARQIINDKE